MIAPRRSERDEIAVVDDQLGSPTSALDLADGSAGCCAGGGGGAGAWADLSSRRHRQRSWADLAVAVHAEAADARGVAPIATADWPTPAARPAYSALDSSKFARDFGFVMPDWRAIAAPDRRSLSTGRLASRRLHQI